MTDISLSIVSSSFIHVRAYVRISFLFKADNINNILLYIYIDIDIDTDTHPHTHHILHICASVSGHLCCFYIFIIVNNAAVKTGIQISLRDLAFNSLGNIPEVELLDDTEILF